MVELIKKNTWLLILVAISASFIFPKLGLNLKPYLQYLLMAMMFLSCIDIKVEEVLVSFEGFRKQIVVLLIIHLATPLIIFLLRGFFSSEIYLGLILASTIPAGRSAVFLSNIYGGEPTKALVVTSISNIISPIMVPLLVWIFAHQTINISALEMSSTIIWLVIVPITLAVIARYLGAGKYLKNYTSSISVVILFFIILGIISPIINVVFNDLVRSVVLLVLVGMLIVMDFGLGYLVGAKKPEKITFAISSSYKNYTLATLLAFSLFSPIVALPAVIYTVMNNFLLIPLQLIFLRKK